MYKDIKTEDTVKRLEESAKNASPDLKKEVQEKINALKGNKFISK